jgi:phosphatidylglycerophosphatase A
MEKVHRLISTCLGIGYTPKGGGTVAAAACCIVWYFAGTGRNESFFIELSVTLLILVLGTWSAHQVEAEWGKDSSKVVIDEVAGMCISLLAVPITWLNVLIGLVLFRFFDIAKPLYIRRMEKLNGGWGVMLDDVLAGVYANIVLQLIVLVRK